MPLSQVEHCSYYVEFARHAARPPYRIRTRTVVNDQVTGQVDRIVPCQGDRYLSSQILAACGPARRPSVLRSQVWDVPPIQPHGTEYQQPAISSPQRQICEEEIVSVGPGSICPACTARTCQGSGAS